MSSYRDIQQMRSLEQIVTDQILSEPEHAQARILEDLPMSIRENISREKSIRRKKKAVAIIVAAIRRFRKKPDIQLLRWALPNYPAVVGQMTPFRTLRICLAQEIADYYFDDDGEIDLNTFLRWLTSKGMIGGSSELIDIIHQILIHSEWKRQLFYTRILQQYYPSIHDFLRSDREISSEVRERYYALLNDGVDEHTKISYADFKTFIPLIDDIDMDELYGLLPPYIDLDKRDIELLLSLLYDKGDLFRLYAIIPSFQEFNTLSHYFNR
jgi:hypothetical protein